MIVQGRIAAFVILILIMGIVYIFLKRAEGEYEPKLRTIQVLEVIPEAIGRCVELDKALHYTVGAYGGLVEKEAATNIAGLSILGYVARLAAERNCRVIHTTSKGEIWPVAQEIMKSAYAAAGKPDYPIDNRFLPGYGYNTQNMQMLYSGVVGAHMMIGLLTTEALYQGTAAATAGCIQIGGTTSMSKTPILVAVFDYVMLGDELFAAGAITSGNKSQMATLNGLDLGKGIVLVFSLLASLALIAGSDFLLNLLSM